jgi:tetratricopeptide (TPR) repeat protein
MDEQQPTGESGLLNDGMGRGHASPTRQIEASLVSSVKPIVPSSGWEAIGQQLSGHLTRSEQLSRRGVLLSARDEAKQALLVLSRHLDLLSNDFISEPAIHSAQNALREVMDLTNWLHTTDPERIQQIVDSHETPVLKKIQWDKVSPLTIAQHYHWFAERSLIDASRGHPWFSDILYVLGRTYQAEADQLSGAAADTFRMHALTHYRAALEIRPSHALAANQAGYVLLRLDRPWEARAYLIASVNQYPNEASLKNLIEASRRLSDHQTERIARELVATMPQSVAAEVSMPQVEIVDQRTFAALSPMTAGPKSPPVQHPSGSSVQATLTGRQTSR